MTNLNQNVIKKNNASLLTFKKGDLLQIKEAFKSPYDSKIIEVGSRAILQKGGKKIEFELACCPSQIYSPNLAFMNGHFEPAKPIFDDNLIGVGIKNLRMGQGRETPSFYFDFIYNGSKVGYADNSGNGEANSFVIYNSKELEGIFNKLITDVAKSNKKKDFYVSELLVEYFAKNFHKGLCTFDSYVKMQ